MKALQMLLLRRKLKDISWPRCWRERKTFDFGGGIEGKFEEQFLSTCSPFRQIHTSVFSHRYPRWNKDTRTAGTFGGRTQIEMCLTRRLFGNCMLHTPDPVTTTQMIRLSGRNFQFSTFKLNTLPQSHPSPAPATPPPGQEDEDKKAAENQIRALRYTMYAMGGLFLSTGMYIFFTYGAPMIDQNGEPIRDEFSDHPFVVQYGKRAAAEIRNYVNYIVNPSRDKLLPNPVKPPYHQPYYTLLIELNGVLVHPEWTYKTGWRFKKRPGVDYFLNQVGGSGYQFEIVIYTHEPGLIAFPIVDALDQQNVVHYRLFRDSTKYENGVHLKDLDKVNRDLSKVIIVDCNEKAIHNHRNNAIVLPRWEGNDDDRALYDLAALIQTIGHSEVKDVRGVLEYYADYPDPVAEYRRKQQVLAQQEQEAFKKAEHKVGGGGFTATGSLLGSLFRKS